MTELIRQQLQLLGVSLYTGAFLAVLYDLIRVYRIVRKSNLIWISFQDIVYWIVFAIITYKMFLEYNYGGVRTYGFIGILLGMAIYFAVFSRCFVKYTSKALINIMNCLLKALKIVYKPIKLIGRRMKKQIVRVNVWLNQIIMKIKQRRAAKKALRQAELAKEVEQDAKTTIEV